MDITGIDIAACGTMIGTIITSIGAVMKATKTEALAKQQKAAYEEELADLRERIAIQEKQGAVFEKRLDDGDFRFKDFEKSLGKISDDVSFIRGLLEGEKSKK